MITRSSVGRPGALRALVLVASLAGMSAHAATQSVETRIIANLSGFGVDRSVSGAPLAGVSIANDQFTRAPLTFTTSATAGNGSLSTFASAFAGPDRSPFVDDGVTAATASLTDRFVVQFDSNITNKVLLDFAIHASGSVSYTHGNNNTFKGASSKYSMSVDGLGFSKTVSGGEEAGQMLDLAETIRQGRLVGKDYHNFLGQGLLDFQLTLEANADTANSFSLAMSSQSIASIAAAGEGSFAASTADFGSTLRWLGIARAYLPDGSPYTGALSITSESGYDYGKLVTAVPEPETYALMLGGLMLIGWSTRRRLR